jgi:hypothetical protein
MCKSRLSTGLQSFAPHINLFFEENHGRLRF